MRPASPSDTAHNTPGWRIAYWLCQVAGWGAYVVLGLSLLPATVRTQPVVIGGYALFFAYSIALTHAFRGLIRRRQWLALPPASAIWRLALAALTLGTLLSLLIILVQWLWTRSSPFNYGAAFVVSLWFSTTSATMIWTALYTGIVSLQRSRRARLNATALELGMREARLQSLEAQVNPHFLFNCLNSVRGLILENPSRAQDMVTRLANILRHNLIHRANATEPLADQLAVITDYLELESVRLEERLRSRIEIDPPTRSCLVPWMLLQTLVENAIKHGIARLPKGGDILVQARIHENTLEITVENTGALGPSPASSTKIGLANIRERLRLLHGPTATLTLESISADRVRTTARLPLQIHSAP